MRRRILIVVLAGAMLVLASTSELTEVGTEAPPARPVRAVDPQPEAPGVEAVAQAGESSTTTPAAAAPDLESLEVLDGKVAAMPTWPGLAYELDLMQQAQLSTDLGAFIRSLLPQAEGGDLAARFVISTVFGKCQGMEAMGGTDGGGLDAMERRLLMQGGSRRLQRGLHDIERCRPALAEDIVDRMLQLAMLEDGSPKHPALDARRALLGVSKREPEITRSALTETLPSGHPEVYRVAGVVAAMIELETTGEPSAAHAPWNLIACRKRLVVRPDDHCGRHPPREATVQEAIRLADAVLVEDWDTLGPILLPDSGGEDDDGD